MEITFKNTSNKGKQCQQFISILKKLKFQLSTKDRRVYFYVDQHRFSITTYAARNIEDPPANSPSHFIQYTFGKDMYSLTNFTGDEPFIFCFDIQTSVRMITHYYESKMNVLKLIISEDISQGSIEFSFPDDQTEGYIGLKVEKVHYYPSPKDLEKSNITCIDFFQIAGVDAQKLKELENIQAKCWYQIHEHGINLKGFGSSQEESLYVIDGSLLKDNYEPTDLKSALKMNVFILEPNNLMLDEIKNCSKKKYKKTTVRIVNVKSNMDHNFIKHSYLQIKSKFIDFSQSYKTIIARCELSEKCNPEGVVMNYQPLQFDHAQILLKNEQNQVQTLKRAILNKWSEPYSKDYAIRRQQKQQQKQDLNAQSRRMFEDTNVRKIKFKIEGS